MVTLKVRRLNPLARSTMRWIAKSIKATNQNFGAMIRISSIDTARWTRQCASSGSAQPVFWSLPSAIQVFCRKKSATTCLAVRTSIHPTSAPTATDDDMGGNDKLTPFAKTDNNRKTTNSGVQRKPGKQFDRQFPIYGTSRAGLHLCEPGKTQDVTILRYNRALPQR